MELGPFAIPIMVFVVSLLGVWSLLSLISQRNSRAQDRLDKHSRRASLAEIDLPGKQSKDDNLAGIKKQLESMGSLMQPKSELEQSQVKILLANAGFRSETASGIFQGIRFACLIIFASMAGLFFWVLKWQWPMLPPIGWTAIFVFLGMFGPGMVLGYLKSKRQMAIFLQLPDALDLLVVCVESGLGLDAAMRRVTEEMKEHARIICEEFTLANFQLQMGRPRREVLHDLGVRTGVDDVRSLAAILIQADRFGSSIAQALRVQSDSMRTRRRQLAEEKAAKTAVQMIFPLVLCIFPGIFVVLVGPAAITIVNNLMSMNG